MTIGRAQHADEVFGSDRPTKRALALRGPQIASTIN